MGGTTPTEGPINTENVTSQPMTINPNQRTFQSFNPNLPNNLYGNVITGKSNYNYTPENNMSPVVTDTRNNGSDSYFSPVVPPVAPAVDVPFTIPPVIQGPYIDDPTDGFNDSLSSNTPVLTTDELRSRIAEEEQLRQDAAQLRADELTARANANPNLAGLDNKIFLQNQLEGGSSVNTGSYSPGFSAEETNAAAFDPRGPSQIPELAAPVPSSGTTFVNDYSNPATLAQYYADRAPGGIFYESSGSQRAEAAQQAAVKAKDDALAQTINTSEVLDLTKNKYSAQQWLKDNGYGNYDKDDASDVLRSKVADINKSQLQQGVKDGIVYTDDRREVYVDGVMVGKPKRADDAKMMLERALAAKEATQSNFNNGTPMVTQNYNYGTNMVTPGGK